jgi:UDP-glucose 4-epimerase
MKKILILGTGFIGSEIAYTFQKKYEIIAIDHGKNFSQLKKKCKLVKFVKGDIYDSKLIKKISSQVDIIFYCGNTGGVVDCIKNKNKFEKINGEKFQKLIDALKNNKQLHFFLFSSAYVYSDLKINKETDRLKPNTLYGKFRKNQELILQKTKLNFTILRISNIFGYGHFMNLGNMGAIEKFINKIFEDQKIILHGDGSQNIDYVNKMELIKILKKLIKNLDKNRIYNVSSGENYSILDIAKKIKKISNEKYSIKIKIIKENQKKKMQNLPKMSVKKIIENEKWDPHKNLEREIIKMSRLSKLEHKRKIGN